MKNLNFLKLIMLIALTSFSCISSTLNGDFINLGFPALDIGVGSEGDCCVAGTNFKVYCYDFMEGDWIRIETKDLVEITRLDVDSNGTIYILSVCGIYYLDCENRWVKIAGTATDIGVGVDGTVWKVGTDIYKVQGISKRFNNFGIWRLFCDCDCLCICTRICIRFRPRYIDPCAAIIAPKCHWFRVDGYGINIDVMPDGDAVFTVKTDDPSHTTVKTVNHHGMYLRDYLCGTKEFHLLAGDITVGNTGVVYVTIRDALLTSVRGDVYKCHRNREWKKVNLNGVGNYSGCTFLAERISAAPYNQLWFVHRKGSGTGSCNFTSRSQMVFTSSQFQYIYTIPKIIISKSLKPAEAPPAAPAAAPPAGPPGPPVTIEE